jgi:Helicase conserved C-terminal domain
MPRKPGTKKTEQKTTENKSPKNVTKRKSKTILGNVIDETSNVLRNAFEIHPIQGISPQNKLLDALISEGEQSAPVQVEEKKEEVEHEEVEQEEPIIDKKGKITLNRDNIEEYILNVLSKTHCDKNYQYKPEQQERYDELIKMPATSNKPDKNSLKKELAKLLDVPLESLNNTKKYGLPTQPDFVNVILCLENFFKENKQEEEIIKEPEIEAEVEPVQELEQEQQEAVTEQEPAAIQQTGVTTDEETRKTFEDENVSEPEIIENKSILFDSPIPNVDDVEKTEIETEQEKQDVPKDITTTNYNTFLFNKEIRENENFKKDEAFQFLYPELNDPNFNIKIAKHKEFSETKYDGATYDIEEHAKKLCNTDFELTPHQLFVKNFLSMQTPYNCLLLYHGLGTGKSCSSIGIAEEMRAYMKQVGLTQPILIIASPNVQENYRLQLFDERKLRLEAGLWKLNTCIGEALLQEVNPTNIIGIPKDRIISEINSIISKNYRFMGYIELANYIKRVIKRPEGTRFTAKELLEIKIKKIRKYFDNRLIIIDEVHNIHVSDKNKEDSKTATLLMDVARYTTSMRLLLLSATPMYNSYNEIIWLTNLINIVNKQSTIRESDVFNKDGDFREKDDKKNKNTESGRELLTRKLTGYVSYVRGENPYTFPYRVYPDVFSPENSLDSIIKEKTYPTIQMNGREIDAPLQNIPVFLTEIGEYQSKGYDFIIKHLRNKSTNTVNKFGEEREMPSFENMDSFGYYYLLNPIEALDIVFPNKKLDMDPSSPDIDGEPNEFEDERNEELIKGFIGKTGLANTMNFTVQTSPYANIYDFEYKSDILENHGRIFHTDNIGKYSNKIAKICECIKKSKGIVLIYSQYIEGSIIPMALALEEMGINRYSSANYAKSLFKTPPTEPIDSLTMKPKSQFLQDNEPGEFTAARYVMITGNAGYSPNNLEDIKYVTNPNNMNGEKVKVVIISKTGSEGLDFKCIRQIHILEPWYNMSRIEQIIGRGVRNFSHCMLDFKDRNVEIYLHSTLPRNDEEPADLYIYRYAEKKAKVIGKVNRLLKEIAVDCLLNIGQHNFTIEQLSSLANNKNIKLRVSSRPDELIDFKVGDRDYSDLCDYEKCSSDFKCTPNAELTDKDINKTTYNDDFAKMNYASIVKRIRDLFKKRLAYTREQLIGEITVVKKYPEDQIDFALSRFINNKNEYISDEHGRSGYLINRDNFYVFQPLEITDEDATMFDRSLPIDNKRGLLELELEKPKQEEVGEKFTDEREYVRVRYDKLLGNINNIFMKIDEAKTNKLTKKLTKETDWYINYGYVHSLLLDKHLIDNNFLDKYVIYHYLDTLPLNDRLVILRYYYSGEKTSLDSLSNEKFIQRYFDEKLVKVRGSNAIILSVDNEDDQDDEGRRKTFIQDKSDTWLWNEAEPTDQMEAKRQSAKLLFVPLVRLNRLFGFMQVLKDNIVFKTLDTSAKTMIGSVCNVEGKKDVIKRINIISAIKYSDKDPDSETNINSKDIVKPGLCVVLEILFRYYDETNKDNKRWFLNNEQDPYQ